MQPSYAVIAIGLSAVVVLSPLRATAQADSEVNSSSRDREEAAIEDAAKVTLDDKPLPDAETLAGVETEAVADRDEDAANAETIEVAAVEESASSEAASSDRPAAEPAANQAAGDRAATEPTESETAPASEQVEDEAAATVAEAESDAIAQAAPPVNQPLPAPAENAIPDAATPVETPQPAPNGLPAPLPPSAAPGVAAPEYLFNDPNPLQFPTQPEEVTLIGTQPITLEQAIELAQRNSRELQAAQLTVERARAQLRQAEAANLPTVRLGTDLTSRQVSRTTQTGGTGTGGTPIVIPSPSPSPGVTPTPSPGITPTPSPGVTPSPTPGVTPSPTPGATPTPSPTPGATPTPTPAPLSRQVQEQQTPDDGDSPIIPGAAQLETNERLETSLNANLQVEYDLFTAGRRSGQIRASERQVRFQELQLEVTAEDLRQNVTRDYYAVQEADELVRISQASVAQNEQSVRDAQAQEAAGIGTRFDVLQAQVDLANAQQELTQRLSDQRVARRQLAARLNLPQSIDISAADPIDIAGLWDLSLEDSIVLAFRNRAELEQQLVQREIGQQQRRVALAATGPQVGLFAGYNVQNNLTEGNGFSDSFQFGAQFNILLFDGGAARANADQEEANIASAEVQFANTRDQVRFQVEQAFLNRDASFANIQTASLALTQAAESLRLARLRFQAGVGIQSDVLRAQTQLTQAEVNRLQAVLGYNRALADLRRAVSNFPDVNLADTP